MNFFCVDVKLSEHWLMRGRSPSPELWKGVDAFLLDFFDRVTLGLGSKQNNDLDFCFE